MNGEHPHGSGHLNTVVQVEVLFERFRRFRRDLGVMEEVFHRRLALRVKDWCPFEFTLLASCCGSGCEPSAFSCFLSQCPAIIDPLGTMCLQVNPPFYNKTAGDDTQNDAHTGFQTHITDDFYLIYWKA